jgi:FkbM family methyltransferase
VREQLWLWLRRSSFLRGLYAHKALAGVMRSASQLLVPNSSCKQIRVPFGPAKGLVLEVDPRWEHFYWDGTYEPESLQTFLKYVKRGDVVFDIGSGIGFYALLAARAGATVFTFEPNRESAEAVFNHLRLNRLQERVHLVSQAAFSRNGWLTLQRSDGTSAHHNARVSDESTGPAAAERVPCITLDDFTSSNPAPTFIKMDVEGAESEVLKGAEGLFRRNHPVLLCEVHDEPNAHFVQGWLQQRNYQCQWLQTAEAFPRHLLATPPPAERRIP